ncbi:MAG: S9 family peptidase, partial [Bacteroidales bacterium]|nr:S9 family peptidase [Bacteroidales bacterium]
AFAPNGWIISDSGRLKFSDNGIRLQFSTAPMPREVDNSILASKRPNVQVWSWDEPVQYTAQDYNKDRDSKKTYTAIYDFSTGKALQITTEEFPNLTTEATLNADYALLSASDAYSISSMWEGRTRNDYYSVNLKTGARKLLKQADYSRYRLSPEGKYAYGYCEADSVWRSIDIVSGETYQITDKSFKAWDTDNDVPDYAGSYGNGGWLAGDEYILLYDRYDIYKVPVKGGKAEKLTADGAEKKIQYRFAIAATENGVEKARDLSKKPILTGWNETTKGYGYYRLEQTKKGFNTTHLISGDYMLGGLTKAEKAEKYLFTKERFDMFPDLYLTDSNFKKIAKITNEAAQQEQFIWGSAELISWTTYKGKKIEGVIYKPANFDPTKKYPMVVNFYERNAETLYSFRQPQPHRSTPDYHLYNSNGYIVFNPDVVYTDGHPGESCYDCVMSGIDAVLKLGYVDEKHIGAAGHSWGGYQTAYLATRTDRFAALESGAPVVNMFSAYGGIRWGSGMARAFQYEHGQSRVGKSIWEAPELYKENSPLFNMDKVTTPLLIMHNDTDGHVPWYQGIEFTVALKRNGKTYWMLNYTGEPHWPVKMANRLDFQTRMMQFFNHYLKGEPMPKWMSEGVRAVDQPYELGY